MLRPSKHSHPDQTVMHVALLLLRRLKKHRVEAFQDLLSMAKDKVRGGGALFLPALDLLYLLGLVEYRSKTDSIEYVGPHEVI